MNSLLRSCLIKPINIKNTTSFINKLNPKSIIQKSNNYNNINKNILNKFKDSSSNYFINSNKILEICNNNNNNNKYNVNKRNYSSSSNSGNNNNNNYNNKNNNNNNESFYKKFENSFEIKRIKDILFIIVGTFVIFKIYDNKIGIVFCENEIDKETILNDPYDKIPNEIIVELKDSAKDDNIIEESDEDDGIKKISSFKLFFKTIGNDIWLFGFGIITAFFSSWVGLQIPKVFGVLIDCTKNGDSLQGPAIQAIFILLAQAGLNFLYSTMISGACERYSARLRSTLFGAMLEQEIWFFDQNSTGDLINRLSSDVQLVRSALKHSVSLGVKSFGQIVGGVISLILISPKLSLGMMTILPTMVSVGTFYAGWLKSLSVRSQRAQAQSTIVAEEAIGNIRTVQAFSNQHYESERFIEKNQHSLALSTESGVQIGIFQGVTSLALNSVSLLVYWYGGTLVSRGEMTGGQLTSFIIHTMNMQSSFSQLSILFTQIMSAMGGMQRITELINRVPLINSNQGFKLRELKGEIKFINVDFKYPTRPHVHVLNGLNLTLKPGQVVALAGSSGGGKSTIAGLLERFYDISNGDITIDGYSIKQLNAKWLRSRIGIVSQEPSLFATTILENLRYGNPNATEDEIIEAAKLANAHQFISNFPKGYETIVGERGVQLSGGQKQRIAIARAILKNPQIIILDEATSALDSQSELLVQTALDNLMKGRTTLVIAHRLSTVQNADLIGVLSHGKIAEFGNHNELMNHKGLYYKLVQRQLSQQQQ
nr:ABC transporter AbcB4 [Dictyostelium discoideum]